MPAPHRQANACKIFRLLEAKSLLGNFTNFKTFFPVVSLACLCQKLKKKKKMEWLILKEVHFWAAPPSIGHYRKPLNGPLPHPFQGIRCESLKIDTLTLDTLRLV